MSVVNIFHNWESIEVHPGGTIILSDSDEVGVLYVILSGEVEISLHDQVLSTESAGSIIGEMAEIPSAADNPTVKAVSEVELARLERDQFNHLISTNPSFAHHALAQLANRLRVVNAFVSAQLEPRK